MFAMILVIATLVTGIFWFLDRFIFSSKQFERLPNVLGRTFNPIHKKTLREVTKKFLWVETLGSFFPVLGVVLIVRSFIYEPFQIPSGSMVPTLLIGDFILVEKFSYGIKDPIYQKTLIKTGRPKRGDIVVFKYPDDPRLDYIKRVIGLPGDKVTYNPVLKELRVEFGCSPSNTCEYEVPIFYSHAKRSNFIQTFPYHSFGIPSSDFLELSNEKIPRNAIRLVERQEILGEKTTGHSILTVPFSSYQLGMYYQQPGQHLATWIVPPGKYFMMGDNRDNSADSRYWGFVPEENLVGKATAIWMSFKKQQRKWPDGVRFHRIGRIY